MIKQTTFECMRSELTIRGTEYRLIDGHINGEKLPIAIVSHGFMNNQTNVCHYAKLFAEMGYAAYCFDFCGGSVDGMSDGKTIEMSALTEVEDLKAVIEYTKALPYTDESNILLMGCSQGGFVSALVASQLKDEIEKLIMFFPAFCMPDAAKSGKMVLATYDPANIPDVIASGDMLIGKCYITDVIDMDPYKETKAYQGDVLIVHGDADKLVDIEYSKRACENYLSSDGKKDINSATGKRKVVLEIIQDGRHGFSKEHDDMAMEKVRRFIG